MMRPGPKIINDIRHNVMARPQEKLSPLIHIKGQTKHKRWKRTLSGIGKW